MSKIEWTGQTWNPVTGCTRASAGCDNCYAVTMTRRLAAMGQTKYDGLINPGKKHFNGIVKCHEDALDIPLRKKKPTTFFVNSMSDLFHEAVPFEFIAHIFRIFKAAPQHTFQVLTKRPARLLEFYRWWDPTAVSAGCNFYPNLWLGVSVENQTAAEERIPYLLQVPAAVRFLSCEPLLGPLDLQMTCTHDKVLRRHRITWLEMLDWVIVGGESGRNARPMHPAWARSLRDQCKEAGTAFFFKQWGEWGISRHEELLPTNPHPDGYFDEEGRWQQTGVGLENPEAIYYPWRCEMQRRGKAANGRLLYGEEHNAMPKPLVSP